MNPPPYSLVPLRAFAVLSLLSLVPGTLPLYSASAVAWNAGNGNWSYAKDCPTKRDAERLALNNCPGGEIVRSGGEKGMWAIAFDKPIVTEDGFMSPTGPFYIGVSAGIDDPQVAKQEAYNDCLARGGTHPSDMDLWKETVGSVIKSDIQEFKPIKLAGQFQSGNVRWTYDLHILGPILEYQAKGADNSFIKINVPLKAIDRESIKWTARGTTGVLMLSSLNNAPVFPSSLYVSPPPTVRGHVDSSDVAIVRLTISNDQNARMVLEFLRARSLAADGSLPANAPTAQTSGNPAFAQLGELTRSEPSSDGQATREERLRGVADAFDELYKELPAPLRSNLGGEQDAWANQKKKFKEGSSGEESFMAWRATALVERLELWKRMQIWTANPLETEKKLEAQNAYSYKSRIVDHTAEYVSDLLREKGEWQRRRNAFPPGSASRYLLLLAEEEAMRLHSKYDND